MKLLNVLTSGFFVLAITVPSHSHSLRGKLPSHITPTEMIPAPCYSDDQCTPTIRSRASYPVTGVEPCQCYAASTTHPFDECEGNEYQCAMFRCVSDNFDMSCYDLEAYCDIKPGDSMGQCTLPTIGLAPRLPSSSSRDSNHPSVFSIEGTNWLAEELYVDGQLEPALSTDESPLPIILEFGSELNDDRILNLSGQTGCNYFDGGYDILFGIDTLPQFKAEQPTINVRNGCHNDIMRQERAFMDILRQDAIIYQISTDGEELRLYDVAIADNGRQTQGNLMAIFSRYPYRSRLVGFFNSHVMPIGSNWEATSISGLDELVISADNEPITMFIDSAPDSEGFRVSGYAGCNWFNGDLEFLPVPVIGGMPLFLIDISQVFSTRRGCFDDASMKQERLFLNMLRQESPLAYVIRRIASPDDIHTTIGEELLLYSVNTDENGDQYQGELLAQFFMIPPPSSESAW